MTIFLFQKLTLQSADGHFGTAGFKLTGTGEGWKLEKGSLKGGSKMHVVQSETSTPTPLPQRRPSDSKTLDVLGFKIDPIEVIRRTASMIPSLNDHSGLKFVFLRFKMHY